MNTAAALRQSLGDALSRAESRRRSRLRSALAHPVRHLAPLACRALGPRQVTCSLFSGQRLRVVLPEIVGDELYRYGFIEAPVTRVVLERLGPGMVFVDIGAHYGYYAVLASALVGARGAVLALEPGRATFELLLGNVARCGNVTAVNAAAGASPGRVLLHDYGRRHSALSTVLPSARIPPHERKGLSATAYQVQRMTVDQLCAAHGVRPDVVKLDAEGAELDVLRGMRTVLAEASPVVSMETGDYDDMQAPRTAVCIDFLAGMGYRPHEHAAGLSPHRRRERYGYGNLFFLKDP